MGKTLRQGFVVVALLLAVGFIFVKYGKKHEPVARVPLPDGTELRLEYVTYGTEHRIPGAGKVAEWLSRLGSYVPRSNFTYYRSEYIHRVESGQPCPVLWFTQFDPQTGKFWQFNGLGLEVVEDPKLNSGHNGFGDGTQPLPNTAYEVPCYDRRKPDFRLRVTAQGQTSELVVPNPVAGTRFPEWKPEPLPQTRPVAGGDVVLRSLTVSQEQHGPRVNTDLAVVAHGQKAPGFAIWSRLSDATGNTARNSLPLPLSEPAWKVQATVRRTGDFPFANNDGLTLGPVEMPGVGQFRTFKLPEADMKEGFRMAVLFGPGHFLWENGVFTEVSPPGKSQSIESRAERDFGGAWLKVDSNKPILVFLFGFSKDATAEMKWVKQHQKIAVRFKRTDRVEDQEYGLLSDPPIGGSSSNSRMIGKRRAFDLRDDDMGAPPAGTPVSIQIVPVEDETVEFLVAPPKLGNGTK